MSKHSTDTDRLLLGMAGWPHPEWQAQYFPEDLPGDWQFAYFSNDADCLLLRQAQWQAIEAKQWEDWLQDVDEHFRFYLHCPAGLAAAHPLPALGQHLGAVLLPQAGDVGADVPQWSPSDGHSWVDSEGLVRLLEVPEWPVDLRAQRTLLERLPEGLHALVIADATADPARLADTRRLAELLQIA